MPCSRHLCSSMCAVTPATSRLSTVTRGQSSLNMAAKKGGKKVNINLSLLSWNSNVHTRCNIGNHIVIHTHMNQQTVVVGVIPKGALGCLKANETRIVCSLVVSETRLMCISSASSIRCRRGVRSSLLLSYSVRGRSHRT